MMARRRIRIALAGVGLALFVVLAALAGWLLPEARPASAHIFDLEATSVTITSNPGADGIYETGDTITLQVLFNRCIYNTSSGAIAVTIGENTRSATGNGNHSSIVTFSYTVVAGDLDSDGISVATNALSGTWNITPASLCATSDGPPHSHPSPALPNTLASAQAGHKVIVDYDTDDDNLIDITTLAQLNAIRHDPNGNGDATHADYAAAFPNRETSATGRMGCATTCAGYELMADLDFDTTGDDDVADAPYANWTPIGTDATPFSATFQGNGHRIANLNVNAGASVVTVGLFGTASGAISGVGLPNASVAGARDNLAIGTLAGTLASAGTVTSGWATGSVTSSSAGSAVKHVGGLVGYNGGAVRASYAGVTVTATTTAPTVHAGGLAGYLFGGAVTASYATGAVAGGATNASHTGGLAGRMYGSASITASYATGAVTSGASANTGGLVATRPAGATVTNSYYNTDTSGASGPGAGRTTSALQMPTAYGTTGIYSGWNVDLDNADNDNDVTTGGDDPWDFGANNQYPILQYDRDAVGIEQQRSNTGKDYDDDDDNLIDITTLAQLDAIRYDLDGDGVSVKGADAVKYANAFPGLTAGMGCPATCAGYELRADLDFDTDGTPGVGSGDAYPNWTPIGVIYAGAFKGNNHTIANLTINAAAGVERVGLFGSISGAVSGVGLPDASVSGASDMFNGGALVGIITSAGSVTSSWATGSVASTDTGTGTKRVGGLVGHSRGDVRASYSRATVSVNSAAAASSAGGLVGILVSGDITASYATGAVSGGLTSDCYAGGLAGASDSASSVITASYATGTVTAGSGANTGGLVGFLFSGATVVNSYWDTETSGITGGSNGVGKTTSELQSPTAYGTGIYADWNVDVGGTSANDDPWDFGYAVQYPVLQYDGLDVLTQGRDTIVLSPDPLSVGENATVTYTVRLGGEPKAGTVTVTITSPTDDAITIDGPDSGSGFSDSETMTFDADNWDTARTVRVSAGSDANLADDTATLTHTAAGAGSGFEDVTASLSVTIDDTTTPEIALTRNSGAITTLDVTEQATPNVTYDVALSHAPLANVTVTVTVPSDHTASLRINKAGGTFASSQTLTFTPTNYNTAQTVTIQAPNDGNNDNETGITLSHAATDATATASGYDGISKDLTVDVTDDDIPNILLSQASLSVEEEDASGESYTVRLSTLPSADVTITVTATGNLTIDGPDAATAFTTGETLTFSATDGTTAQTINVKAGGDNDLADDTTPTITHRATSADTDYNTLATKTLSVTITDDDTGSLVLSPTAPTVKEGDDAGATYTVKLSHRPSATVTVTVASGNVDVTIDDGDGAFGSSEMLNFNAANWNTPQTVTVKAARDANLLDSMTILRHTTAGAGSGFANLTIDLAVNVHDTTAPAITLTPTALSIEEGADGTTYTVALDAEPPANTTVAITSSNPAVSVDPGSLPFTTVNYGTPQTVTVNTTADDDAFHDASALAHTPSIRGIASPVTLLPVLLREPAPIDGGEPARTRITPPPAGASVTYGIDSQMITVTRAAGVPDGVTVNTVQSLTADLTIALTAPPEDTPTTLSGFSLDGDTLVDIAPDSVPAGGLEICLPRGDGATRLLHYRSGRWQVVPGSAPRGDQVCGTVSEFSPFIAGQPAAVAPETEPERPPIIYNLNIRFDARRIALPEGHTASYRVRLAGRPGGRGATIRIRSDNPDVKPTPAELRFTAADWEQWQRVSIAIAGDANHTDESATLAHYGPNRGYGSVLVSVIDTGDSRQAGDTIPPALTVVTEPGARWGVTVTPTVPADLTAHGVVRVSPAYGVPRTATGYGLGRNGVAQAIVSIAAPADAPASGLTVCLPVAGALADEAGERPLTLLRYADAGDDGGNAGWQAVSGAEYNAPSRSVCAAGVTGFGPFAAAYVLP